MAKSRSVKGVDGPTFASFCDAITEYYVNDEIAPALHISRIRTRDGGRAWYVAVHRYPHGWGHADALSRVVVCTMCRPSFGLALFLCYKDWVQVRDLESAEETRRWETLRDSR